ncbi:TPA: RES family NAD+ phosphorylase [Enterobacter asburiae]
MFNNRMWLMNHNIEIEEEEKATGFLCASCLSKDTFLQNKAAEKIIHNNKKCSGCDQEIENGISIEYIAEKINKHLNKHYMPIENNDTPNISVSLREIIKRFVIDDEDVVKSISEILYALNSKKFARGGKYKDLYDQDAIEKQTSAIVDEWGKYAFELKHSMRFTNEKAINFYKSVISYGVHASGNNDEYESPMLKIISIGSEFYRGRRVLDNQHKKRLEVMGNEFYAPPPEKATNSRMSPPGMSFLYTATDQNTCIAELHPFAGDEIAVIKLETERSLYFFDLTRAVDVKHGLPGLIHDPSAKIYARRHLLSQLHDLIAQPFRATDISYTAIQAFAETVRHYEFTHRKEKRKFDGIIFNSTQMNGGVNYVFFGDNLTEPRVESPFENFGVKPSVKKSVKFYKISNIQVTTIPPIINE